ASTSKSPDDNGELFNHYQNAVYAQDRTIADLLASLHAAPVGARTVVLYTSDHGEAFREHGQLGHTGAVLEEEIHVPAWIEPAATLSRSEREALARAETELTWHVDVAPTILDLLGLAASPELSRFDRRCWVTVLLAGIERRNSFHSPTAASSGRAPSAIGVSC